MEVIKVSEIEDQQPTNIGVVEFSPIGATPCSSTTRYKQPNAKYTLVSDDGNISIHLMDSQGKLVAEFVKNEARNKGENSEVLTLP